MTARNVGSSGRVLPVTRRDPATHPRDPGSVPKPEAPSPLHIVEGTDEIRHGRVQEARARIARRFYEQDEVRREVTRALLAFFGFEPEEEETR